MTREDLQALKKAADTIRRARKDYEDALSWQDEGIARLARGAIASRAEACCSILSAARDIVEAHTASGHDLPARASDLVELLEEIGAPAWLDSFPKSKAEGWKADAAAIIAAARSAGSPARAKPAEKGAGTAQISTSTPATGPNTIYHLNTAKNEKELRRIFAALAEAGFIAGADGGSSMLQPFLDAFNPKAEKQGRIIWTRTPKRGGAAGKPSPTQALDFAALMQGTERDAEQLRADCQDLPLIFEGLAFSGSTVSRFVTSWNKGGGSEYHCELAAIIEGTK